uniref:TF-B3 domain-containing protein n=1 Tax=Arundo donax TaxID=35708 RepID=A0A0A8XUQ4_ARUDO
MGPNHQDGKCCYYLNNSMPTGEDIMGTHKLVLAHGVDLEEVDMRKAEDIASGRDLTLPLYAVRLGSSQIRNGMYFNKAISDYLPQERTDLKLCYESSHLLTYGRAKKYNDGLVYIAGRWTSFVRNHRITDGLLCNFKFELSSDGMVIRVYNV